MACLLMVIISHEVNVILKRFVLFSNTDLGGVGSAWMARVQKYNFLVSGSFLHLGVVAYTVNPLIPEAGGSDFHPGQPVKSCLKEKEELVFSCHVGPGNPFGSPGLVSTFTPWPQVSDGRKYR